MIENDLRTYLETRPAIAEFIGTSPARIYPVKAPQGDKHGPVPRPYMTFRRLSGGHEHTLRGAAGFALPRFDVSAYSDTYQQAKELAKAVRGEMQGFGGVMHTTEVRGATCVDEEDLFDDPIDGSDKGVFHIAMEFQINYTETVTAFTER